MNKHLQTVIIPIVNLKQPNGYLKFYNGNADDIYAFGIIAPMTSQSHNYPTRLAVKHNNKKGWIVLDQIRTIDNRGLLKHSTNQPTRKF